MFSIFALARWHSNTISTFFQHSISNIVCQNCRTSPSATYWNLFGHAVWKPEELFMCCPVIYKWFNRRWICISGGGVTITSSYKSPTTLPLPSALNGPIPCSIVYYVCSETGNHTSLHIERINICGLLLSTVQIDIVRPWDFGRNLPAATRITLFPYEISNGSLWL